MDDFVQGLQELNSKVDAILARLQPADRSNKDVYQALAQAQAGYTDVQYSGENEYYKTRYATLSDLVKSTRPALTEQGLSVFQHIEQDEHGNNFLKTVLAHKSGQTLESVIRIIPPKNTIHHIGSYIAHMRRLTYASLVGVMVHDADDDDGYMCMEDWSETVSKGTKPSYTSPDTHSKKFKRISKDELQELEKSLGSHTDLGQQICEDYHLQNLSELPADKYEFILTQIRKNVARRDGLL